MGKKLISSEQSSVQIKENNNPGCMWGMFQILDYHQWGVKKVFRHKKKRNARYQRKNTLQDQHVVTEGEPLLVMQHGEKLDATGKSLSSPENHKKEPLNEENSEGCSEHALHQGKDGKTTEGSFNHKRVQKNKLNRDISVKFKKQSDVMEVIGVEKGLLLKFLRDIDNGGKKVHQAFRKKASLTKSVSFPLTASSHMKNNSSRSSTFKSKQNEIWAFPKGEKLLVGTQAPKKIGPSLLKEISYERPKTSISDPGVERKPSISPMSSDGLNHKGWNQLVLHQFKVIKQKIKHALVELKKGGHHTSTESINNSASPEYSIANHEKEISQRLDDGVIQKYNKSKSLNETKASDLDSNKHRVRLMRRTSSLNESLDRYTQLFEKSFSKQVKWQNSKSKSLRLINEDKSHRSGHAPMFSRSNLSMPNIESLGFFLHEALLDDTNDIRNAVESENDGQINSVSLPLKIDKSLHHLKETKIVETEGSDRDVNSRPLSDNVVDKIDEVTEDQREDIHEPTVGDGSCAQEKVEIRMNTHLSQEVVKSLETSCQDDATSHVEGSELITRGPSVDELVTDDLPNKGSVLSLPDSSSNTDDILTGKDTNKSYAEKDSNFKYVKDVLEFSGFMGNDDIQMHYKVDRPLKPSLFTTLEASLRHKNESSEEEIIVNPYDHQLLFDLVNEMLFEIYEKSPNYFPRPFFFEHRLHPIPKGELLLKEVWDSVSSYLRLRPELDKTLDDVVGRDLEKRSGWMKIQQEEECVALELEDMIIDDLLDEIVFE